MSSMLRGSMFILLVNAMVATGCGDDDDVGSPDAAEGTPDAAVQPDGPIEDVDAAIEPDAPVMPDAAAIDGAVQPDSEVAPVDSGSDIDGAVTIDGAIVIDGSPPIDAAPTPSEQLQAVRDAADGAVDLTVDGVLVTYEKPLVGSDPAGIFVQADPLGPALFVAVDPTTLSPRPAVGDAVSFRVTAVATVDGQKRITALADLAILSSGNPLAGLVQDVSAATDLVSALGSYESELIHVTGTVGAFSGAGTGHVAAVLTTAGVSGDTGLKLRVTTAVRDELDLAAGCTITLDATPLWRFTATAQASAWNASELALSGCPAPRVVSAVATSPTTVLVTFDRHLAAGSVSADGSQFSFAPALTASAALVSDKTVTLTTTAQTGGTSYTVTVAGTVTDALGAGVDPAFDEATFLGFLTPAVVRINEVNANLLATTGCDLIELRVISGNSMDGYRLRERTTDVLTFTGLVVAPGDFVVVHFNSANATCNPGMSGSETTSVTQQPAATFAQNYDTAWDWYSTDTGLTATDNVFTVYDATGAIMDAVLVADDPTGTAAAASETAAAEVAAVGHWQMVGGGIPAGGFVDDAFCSNAVQDLNGTDDTTPSGTSIQRSDDFDSNDLGGWGMAAATWGARNAGQTTP